MTDATNSTVGCTGVLLAGGELSLKSTPHHLKSTANPVDCLEFTCTKADLRPARHVSERVLGKGGPGAAM